MNENFDLKLAKDNRINALIDFYGGLLTPKQSEYVCQYYADDLSLGEISENFNVSRQAVYDNIRRTEQTLEKYETKMCLYDKFLKRNKIIDNLQDYVKKTYNDDKYINQLVDKLEKIEEE